MYEIGRIVLFRIIFRRNKIHFGNFFTNFPVIKNAIKQIAFENALKSSVIFQPLLYANVPGESPSYAPTFFVNIKNAKLIKPFVE